LLESLLIGIRSLILRWIYSATVLRSEEMRDANASNDSNQRNLKLCSTAFCKTRGKSTTKIRDLEEKNVSRPCGVRGGKYQQVKSATVDGFMHLFNPLHALLHCLIKKLDVCSGFHLRACHILINEQLIDVRYAF
jgi:hypothetical protein